MISLEQLVPRMSMTANPILLVLMPPQNAFGSSPKRSGLMQAILPRLSPKALLDGTLSVCLAIVAPPKARPPYEKERSAIMPTRTATFAQQDNRLSTAPQPEKDITLINLTRQTAKLVHYVHNVPKTKKPNASSAGISTKMPWTMPMQ